MSTGELEPRSVNGRIERTRCRIELPSTPSTTTSSSRIAVRVEVRAKSRGIRRVGGGLADSLPLGDSPPATHYLAKTSIVGRTEKSEQAAMLRRPKRTKNGLVSTLRWA